MRLSKKRFWVYVYSYFSRHLARFTTTHLPVALCIHRFRVVEKNFWWPIFSLRVWKNSWILEFFFLLLPYLVKTCSMANTIEFNLWGNFLCNYDNTLRYNYIIISIFQLSFLLSIISYYNEYKFLMIRYVLFTLI